MVASHDRIGCIGCSILRPLNVAEHNKWATLGNTVQQEPDNENTTVGFSEEL